ncbi:MAG: HAD hydrolase family protein [Ectothiorhodospiraceae bacterium]|nr:HAD hydrolase family protein [Ectothiorhodospiraceae bacterium]
MPGQSVLDRAARTRLLALDVDGVLTDGSVWYGEQGETLKPFNILDGLGIRLLLENGIAVAVITARRSAPLLRRTEDLRIPHVLTGVGDKPQAWAGLLAELHLDSDEAAFMGDDLIDLAVLRRAGLAMTVPNAHPLLLQECHWHSRRPGGQGAVREASELILHAQGRLQAILERYRHG